MKYLRKEIKEGHPVLDKLRSGKKIGLVLEGGGMRGVVVGGAALALEQLGFRSSFSNIYGSSAGALAAAYFAAGQATWGASILYEDLLSPDFFSLKRLKDRKPPMNLDFLFGEIIEKRKPLDWEKGSEGVHVFATHAKTGELRGWSEWQTREDFFGALRASATLPLVAGGAYQYRGEEYFDAGIHSAVPWREALVEEEHLLVILSRPETSPRPPIHKIDSFLARNFFAKKYPSLLPLHLRIVDRYNKGLEKLRLLQKEGRVLVVSPPAGEALPGTYERNRQKLIDGARLGARALYLELFGEAPEFNEMIVSSSAGRPLWKEDKKERPVWWL